MRTGFSCVALLFIAGCMTSPAQTYRPRNYDGPAWEIECEAQLGLVDTPLQVRINGETVIDEKFSDFKDNAEYKGKYEGRDVTASVTRLRGGSIQVMVFVDGERAATF